MTPEKLAPKELTPLPIGRNDPILRELWKIKAQINSEAGYDLDVIFEQAKSLNVGDLSDSLARSTDGGHLAS
jgi:hypothetical protein